MNSSRPYLLNAFITWICDNHCTPYLVVDAEYEGTMVPMQYVEDGKIVLNIAPDAVQSFKSTKKHIEFSATFAGVEYHIIVPMHAVLAIYAQENGRGMVFKDEGFEDDEFEEEGEHSSGGSTPNGGGHKGGKGKPNLHIVK